MPSLEFVRECTVDKTARTLQLAGLFDLPDRHTTRHEWAVEFDWPDSWNVGLIVGASGTGKTTLAHELFGEQREITWSPRKAIVDDFPRELSIKQITEMLGKVGFSAPPSWMKPYHVLSTGQQFRVHVARMLAEAQRGTPCVIDEFTSTVDRTVAQIGSHAVQRLARSMGTQMVAVTCHYDVAEWLEPDWVYNTDTGEFQSGRRLRRPELEFTYRRVHREAWHMFAPHHYLSRDLHRSARCFGLFLGERIVAFSSVLKMPHPKSKDLWREHRTVCLPDFQGIGLGNRCSELTGSVVSGIGQELSSITTHPAMIAYRARSDKWHMASPPKLQAKPKSTGLSHKWKFDLTRMVASFRYVGPAMNTDMAREMWNERL